MAFTLESVVPWGRSFDEYVAMFALSEEDLEKKLLGCGDGPASFNSDMTRRGRRVISVDPIYCCTVDELKKRIDETFDKVLAQTRKNKEAFVWDRISSVEELGRVRMAAMNAFLEDYPAGLQEKRYVAARLPALPFADHAFDLALCSHFLFLYSDHLSEHFHLQSIQELCRLAPEVRIFPLLELGGTKSRHLESVTASLKKAGFIVSIERVDYEFQKGGNELLKITNENHAHAAEHSN